MGAKTGIEWTDSTWNPFIGCSRVSEGCRHCYAERLAGRFSAKTEGVYAGTTKTVNGLQVWTGKINRAPAETLLKPLHWRAPRRIFVNSMSDLFHENVPDGWIDQVFAVMALCPQHVFQVLTKRPERMLAYLDGVRVIPRTGADVSPYSRTAIGLMMCGMIIEEQRVAVLVERSQYSHQISVRCEPGHEGEIVQWPLPNVWLGVSVENQAAADERIPLLLRTPAAVRFISAEPLLGPVTLPGCNGRADCKLSGVDGHSDKPLGGIDWVICGGESGPGARPMHPDWARSLRDQCIAAGVPFFFKQWGEYSPKNRHEDLPAHPTMVCEAKGDVLLTIEGKIETFDSCGGVGDHAVMERIGKKAAGALLDGREWKQFPDELTTEN